MKHDTINETLYTTSNLKSDVVLSVGDKDTLQQYSYNFFGKPESHQTPILGYSGEVHDGSLQYLRARYYDTETGVFISKDTYQGTAEDIGSQNRYSYVQNNNANGIDPSGHFFTALKKLFVGVSKPAAKVNTTKATTTNKATAKGPQTPRPGQVNTETSGREDYSLYKGKKNGSGASWNQGGSGPATYTSNGASNSNPYSGGGLATPGKPSATTKKKAASKQAPPVKTQREIALENKRRVYDRNGSLQQKLDAEQVIWKLDGKSNEEIKKLKIELIKKYCTEMGMTSIQEGQTIHKFGLLFGQSLINLVVQEIENEINILAGKISGEGTPMYELDEEKPRIIERICNKYSLTKAEKQVVKDTVENGKSGFVKLDTATLLSGIALMAASIGLAFVAVQLVSLGLVYTGLATVTVTFANQLLQGAMVSAMVAEVTLMVKTFAGYPLNSTDAVTYAISKIVMIGSNALNTLLKAGIIANEMKIKGERVPPEARNVAEQVKSRNGTPPDGYKGGKVYDNKPINGGQNFQKVLHIRNTIFTQILRELIEGWKEL